MRELFLFLALDAEENIHLVVVDFTQIAFQKPYIFSEIMFLYFYF